MAYPRLKERYGGAALITGASSGIGAVFARKLATYGMDLVLVARRQEPMEALKRDLEGPREVSVHVMPCDLTEPNAPETLRADLDARLIEVGILVNNAGFGSYGLFPRLDPATEARIVDLNCRVPVAMTSCFLPKMVERKRGALIFLSSLGGYQPTPFFATYGATKAFNLMFGEALWAELRRHGVHVVVLSPGFTRTEFQRKAGLTKPRALTGWSSPEKVVEACLDKLGKGPSVIPGIRNWLTVSSIRLMPRSLAAWMSYWFSAPPRRQR